MIVLLLYERKVSFDDNRMDIIIFIRPYLVESKVT